MSLSLAILLLIAASSLAADVAPPGRLAAAPGYSHREGAERARAIENPYGDGQILTPRFEVQAPRLEEFLGAGAGKRRYTLPAEFERQQGLLLGCREMVDNLPDLFADIVEAVQPHVPVVVLVNNVEEWVQARDVLLRRGIPSGNVYFTEIRHDTMWARDYGPMIVAGEDRQPAAINAEYESFTRTDDDDVPIHLGLQMRLSVVSLPMRVDGGNLLSNGQGVCIATQVLLDENKARGIEEPQVRELLERYYGASQTLILEPLVGEPTGHVDMFATFVSADTVLVGSYDPAADPVNAEVLDRNADRLAELRTARGPLRVERIPMPSHDDGIWRTYTNVIYANRVVLMPTYERKDPAGGREALLTMSRLLPEWTVVGIDAEAVAKLGGALHCVSMNLGPVGRMPRFATPRRHRLVNPVLPAEQAARGINAMLGLGD